MTDLKYRADIDGLRGIAVLAVVFFHLDLPLPGGFAGVDIFFVISGYLITAIIISQKNRGTFSFGNFYLRRIRRLFPALLATLLASFVAGFYLLWFVHFERFCRALISGLFFVSNVYFWQESGYFGLAAQAKPLLHTWSLGVEEQFYLLWPAFVVFALYRLPARLRLRGLVLLGVLSLVAAELCLNVDRDAAFYLTPFRICEFAVGAALVFMPTPKKLSLGGHEFLTAISLAFMIVPLFLYSQATRFPGISSMVPCLGAAMLIYFGASRFLGRLINNRALVGVGKISYSLYLVHWPVVAFFKYSAAPDPTFAEKFGLMAVSIVLASMLYFLVESPLRLPRAGDATISNRSFSYAFTSLTALLLASSVAVIWQDGVPSRVSGDILSLSKDLHRPRFSDPAICRQINTRVNSEEEYASRREKCLAGFKGKDKILVVGDSHAQDIYYAFRRHPAISNTFSFTGSGCSYPKKSSKWCRKVWQDFFAYVAEDTGEIKAVFYSTRARETDSAQTAKAIAKYLEPVTQKGIPIFWFGPHMEYEPDIPNLLARSKDRWDFSEHARAAEKRFLYKLDKQWRAVAENQGIRYVSILDIACQEGSCPILDDSLRAYVFDYGHWSTAGADFFAEALYKNVPDLHEYDT